MAQSYVGEIRAVGFNFAPVGWLVCDGSLLSISEYEVLFILIGTTYGGDGVQTFGLPDLRGRTPVHQGAGFVIGQLAGTENVTVTMQTMAAHRHSIAAQNGDGNTGSPSGAVFATSTVDQYGPVANGTAASGAILTQTGSSLPHDNLQPYLCVNYIISLFGVFPSQN
ncbi:phage tail protein [Granulicella mallensis]|uniref:Microcystin-dependent protein n=1 Tax=Granulicella mallensis TaxID=940614 RepID=A0A7W8EBW6_9BACT|nr:tail fiber protein [Granulicella mallensis]MBB5066004.1 microcystin-dependent protein [Granulicella mallensis]